MSEQPQVAMTDEEIAQIPPEDYVNVVAPDDADVEIAPDQTPAADTEED